MANAWQGAWSGHSEGLVVCFYPDSADTWIANFQPGSGSGWEGVLEHPDKHHVMAFARGQGYIVDPSLRRLVSTLSGSIQHVIGLPHLEAIAISDGLGFEAIKADGVWWRSTRISWDEIRVLKLEGTVLRGEASVPEGDWVPFTLDLATGRCEDGIYEYQMRRAIPVRGR